MSRTTTAVVTGRASAPARASPLGYLGAARSLHRAPGMRFVALACCSFGVVAILSAAEARAQTAPLAVAPPPSALSALPPPRLQTHSKALMGGGIALTAFGGLSLFGGLAAFAEGARGGATVLVPLGFGVGIPLLIHAAGCFAGGIPMIVIGARKIPAPALVPLRGGVGLSFQL